MQSLIYKRPTSHFLPHLLPPNLVLAPSDRNQNFLRFHLRKCRFTSKSLTSCSAASSHTLNYGGWDDLQLGSGSVQPGESNQLHNFLNFLGIGDKKYVFVHLFGFFCALAVSRVKVSSLIIFPACAILFAIGFSVGLVKGGHLKELKLNVNKRKLVDETLRDPIEKLRNFGDNLKGYNDEVLKLRNDIHKSIESNQITVSDLEAYIGVIESSNSSYLNAMGNLESCIQSMSNVNLEKEVGSDQESTRQRKRSDGIRFNFSQYFNGLFGGKFDGSKLGKVKDSATRESVNLDFNNGRQENILASSVKQKNLNSARNINFENKNTDMVGDFFDRVDNFADGTMENVVENEKRHITEKNEVNFDDTSSYQNYTSRFVNSQEAYVKGYQDEIETREYQNGSFDSMNFSISMNHTKSAASFSRHQKSETQNRNYSRYESIEEEKADFQRYSYKKEMFTSEKHPSFDLEFNNYLTEANDLLKEAKRSLKQKVVDERAEHALYKSEILLSKAIEMRPMSLLAVGQLGNTYLLHGELKLRISRDLRSVLARNGPFEERRKILKRFDDELANKDKIMPKLVGVCEECEELLIKAGRKYKLALSIDGNDVKALYNWGLALSFRAQLIADIGPSAASDADKVFLAAIDKFDAMMSKSNAYAPDAALFRWGTVLQQRSRLRPKNSREKVKLLQQARRLYQDALDFDSGNVQLQKALSSCVSELDYWYT